MIICDSHTHSSFSFDAEVPMENMVKGAVKKNINVITSTDHCDAIGIYDEKSLKGLPKEFVSKYFTQVSDRSYQISDQIKRCVKFCQHNLLKDRYPKECDLIVCRNVMIYFTEEAKKEIYQKFNASLKKDGLLFVGSTEQIISPGNIGFASFKSFFYKRL